MFSIVWRLAQPAWLAETSRLPALISQPTYGYQFSPTIRNTDTHKSI